MNFLSPFALLLATLAVPLLLLYFSEGAAAADAGVEPAAVGSRAPRPRGLHLLPAAAARPAPHPADPGPARPHRRAGPAGGERDGAGGQAGRHRHRQLRLHEGHRRLALALRAGAAGRARSARPPGRGRRGDGDRGGRAAQGAGALHPRARPGVRGDPLDGGARPSRTACRRGSAPRARWSGPDPRAEIHVFTDGAHPDAIKGQGDDVRVRWTGTGLRSHNVGITNLAVRRSYFGAYNSQAFFSVGNFSGERQTLSLQLTLDDEVLAERTLTLDPQVRRAITVPFSEQRGGVLKLKLDVSDDLDADNTAYAVMPPPRTISVLLVSPGQPVPREGAEDRSAGAARGAQARRLPGRHGGLRRRGGGQRESAEAGQRPLRPRQHRARGRAARGAGAPRQSHHHGLGPLASDHAADRLRQGDDGGRDARPAARRRQDAGGGGGRAADLRPRGARPQGALLRLRSLPQRLPAAGGLPAHALQGAPLAAPGRARPVEPAARRRASRSCCRWSTA